MKERGRKKVSWVLIALFIFAFSMSVVSSVLSEDKTFTQDGRFTYEIRGGEAYITGYYGAETEVIVPEMIEDCPVVSVLFRYDAYTRSDYDTAVKTVVLPESVTILANNAFMDYHALESVIGLDHIVYCGSGAFAYTNISNLEFGIALRYLGQYALIPQQILHEGNLVILDEDRVFPSITIPDDAELEDGFGELLSEIHLIPSGNTPLWTLHEGVLYSADMKSLKLYPGGDERISYIIPDGVERIESNAFGRIYHLTDLVVPRSVTYFADNVFIYSDSYVDAKPCLQVYAESVAHRYCQSLGRPFHIIEEDETVQVLEERINSIVASCVTDDMNDYEKALVLHDWIIDHTEYDSSLTCYSPYNVVFQGIGVCEAYRDTYRLLLNAVGIRNITVAYQNHGWNLVYIENAWYSIDTTWDDSTNSHQYFCLPSRLMKLYHYPYTFDAAVLLGAGAPVNSLKWNYTFINGGYALLLDPYISAIQQQIDQNAKRFSVPLSYTDDEDLTVLDIALNEHVFENTGDSFVAISIDVENQRIWITLFDAAYEIPTDVRFEITEDETATITEYIGSSGTVILPDFIGQYPVARIGNNAFLNQNVMQVVLGNHVVSIGDSAFQGCQSLESITLPDSLASIGERAFSECSSLQSIQLPNNVSVIPKYAFSGCSSLESIILPESLEDIGSNAFIGCSKLDFSITIPETMTVVPAGAFTGCSKLREVVFSGPVTRIEENAFFGCNSLTEISLPETLTYIGSCAFADCSFTELLLPDGLKVIDDYGLWLIRGLKEIHLPSGLESIGEKAFANCSSLERITIQAGNDYYTVVDDILYTKDMKTLLYCPQNTQAKSVTVPYGTERICDSAFISCKAIQEIVLPETVKTIGPNAFFDCSSLQRINIPEGVTEISDYAFRDTAVSAITVPASVRTIGNGAFLNLPIRKLSLPDSVSYIGWCGLGSLHLDEFRIPKGITSLTDQELYGSSIGTLIVHENFTAFANQGCNIGQIQGYAGTYAETLAQALNVPFVDISSIYLNDITVNKETADTGDQIIWQFQTAGGYGSITYLCERYVDGLWIDSATLFDISSYSIYADRPGTYTLKVTATDANNSTAQVQGGEVTVTEKQLEIVGISEPDELKTGQQGIWTVTAEGGSGEKKCRMTVYFEGEMLESGEFSNQFSPSFTPKQVGKYTFVFTVTDEAEGYQTNSLDYQVTAGPLSIEHMDCSLSYASIGNPVHWDVSVSGGTGTTRFVYTVYSDDTVLGQSEELDEASYEWLANECGSIVLSVTATDSAGQACTGVSDPVRVGTYEPLVINSLYLYCSNVDGDGNAALPLSYVVHCNASGGNGSITYTYYLFFNGTQQGKDSGVDLHHTPLYRITQGAGMLTGYVEVTDEEGNYASAAFDPVYVTGKPAGPRITGLYFNTRECFVGTDITWQVTCEGGVGNLQYRYRLYCDDETIAVSDWTENTSWQWTPQEPGVYRVQVTVQDENRAADVLSSMNTTVIASHDHQWGEPEYSWNTAEKTVTGTRICSENPEHIETETVDITTEIITRPTEEAEGSAVLTSGAFENDAFTIQSKSIVIPPLNELAVLWLPGRLNSIEAEAFSNLSCQAIIIPEGCTAIGERAFAGCANLLYVRIPESVESYPSSAFEGCNENLIIDWQIE